jgi:hypothetical protein
MKQRRLVCFFKFKRLKARVIHTELESVYGQEALALQTVKKWQRRFHQGRTDLFGDPKPGIPLTNDFARAIGPLLKERPFSSCTLLCPHFRIGKATCLQILHDKLALEDSVFTGCRMPHQSTRRAKECHIRGSFERH